MEIEPEIKIIGTWHNEFEFKLLDLLHQLADLDSSKILLTENTLHNRLDRIIENYYLGVLTWLIEFLVLSRDPLCIVPVCHGLECDISSVKYALTLLRYIIQTTYDLCYKFKQKCYPKLDYEAWKADYFRIENNLKDPEYELPFDDLLDTYVYPIIKWLRDSGNIGLSKEEWETLYKQIDYVVDNRLCEEDRDIIDKYITLYIYRARDKYFANKIVEKYQSLLIPNSIIFVQLGALHVPGVIENLEKEGIFVSDVIIIKTKDDFDKFLKEFIPSEYKLIGKWVEKVLLYGATDTVTDAGDFIRFEQDSNRDPYFPDMIFQPPYYVKIIRKDDIESLEYLYNKLINDGMIKKII